MARQLLLALFVLSLTTAVARGQQGGWQFRGFDGFRGEAELRLGAKFWRDDARLRNLQLLVTGDLAPWLRGQVLARRREGDWERMPLHPDVDEAYFQSSAYCVGDGWELALDAKVGRVRYLHFPYPDAIASFDQVPGIDDLYGGPPTDYRGVVGTVEFSHRSGLGVHASEVWWGFGRRSGQTPVEAYAFYRRDFPGQWHVELRAGGLANRPEPLGLAARAGGSIYLGKGFGPFSVGLLYEKRDGEDAYTGICVQFARSPVTELVGETMLDYQRSPEGISVQAALARVAFGTHPKPKPGDVLVGEIRAARIRTLWQGGFNRNHAEFRLASWGRTTGPGLRMEVEESPWYLDLEALVSPHTSVTDEWFRDRQGPGQYRQDVTYRFYAAAEQ
jgi:hypothetical protein